MAKKKMRKTNHARLVVGEGEVEKAFCDYLKSQYSTRNSGVSVKTKCAQGGSPENVLDFTIRQARHAQYNSIYVWLDTDIEWPAKLEKNAKSHRPPIELLKSTPCIEGFFLTMLNGRAPHDSGSCKSTFRARAGVSGTCPKDYKTIFPKEELEKIRLINSDLDKLISLCSKK